MRHLIGLGLAALCSVATAQGSITLYGTADGAIEIGHYNRGVSMARVQSGNIAPTRLGLRGSEALGDGVKANFGLEMGIGLDSGSGGAGTTLFSRGAYIGLEGELGRVDVGRMFVPLFWIYLFCDPSTVPAATAGSSATLQHSAALGKSGSAGFYDNNIRYRIKHTHGFDAELAYSPGNELGGARARDGRNLGANLMWRGGPLWAGYGYNDATTHGPADLADAHQRSHMAGLTYDMKWIRLGANVMRSTHLSTNGGDAHSWALTAMLPLAPGELNFGTARLAEAGGKAAQAVHVGYVVHLSRHSMVYGYLTRVQDNAQASRGFALMNSAQATVAAGFDPHLLTLGVRTDF